MDSGSETTHCLRCYNEGLIERALAGAAGEIPLALGAREDVLCIDGIVHELAAHAILGVRETLVDFVGVIRVTPLALREHARVGIVDGLRK